MKKFIFSKVEGLESAALLKLNFFIGYFQGFYCKFYLAAFRTAIFKCNFFPRNTSTSCFLRMLNIQISLLYHEFSKVQKHQESSFYIHFDLIRVRLLVHSNTLSPWHSLHAELHCMAAFLQIHLAPQVHFQSQHTILSNSGGHASISVIMGV